MATTNDYNLKVLEGIPGIPPEFFALVDWLAEYVVDGIVIVDDGFRIRLANSMIVDNFAKESHKHFYNSDYFNAMFGLNSEQLTTEEKTMIPMYRAIRAGKIDESQPLPTFAMPNGVAYQVETHVATFEHAKRTRRVVMEFWRLMGDPDTFKNDDDFVDYRGFTLSPPVSVRHAIRVTGITDPVSVFQAVLNLLDKTQTDSGMRPALVDIEGLPHSSRRYGAGIQTEEYLRNLTVDMMRHLGKGFRITTERLVALYADSRLILTYHLTNQITDESVHDTMCQLGEFHSELEKSSEDEVNRRIREKL